jgi:hypothetical protein
MYPHSDLLKAIAAERVAALRERGEDERRKAPEHKPEEQRPEAAGTSYRLRDGSWLHLRHDSS